MTDVWLCDFMIISKFYFFIITSSIVAQETSLYVEGTFYADNLDV